MTNFYVVATPIGNLEDISLRALRVLKEVDYIFCEDTRVTRKILDHYEIQDAKLVSYHQHSNEKQVAELLKIVRDNDVAMVTDAGTPGISDPGNQLVELLNHEKVKVIPIPGASAVTTALSISGMPTDKFIFKGFVPHKKGRQKFLKQVLESKRTVVFYESPHRIEKTLIQLGSTTDELGYDKKNLVVCRELTKKFETIYRGSAEQVLEEIKKDFPGEKSSIKGEFVVVVGSR